MKFLRLLVYRLSLCSNEDTLRHGLHRLHGSLLLSVLLTANVISAKLLFDVLANSGERTLGSDLLPLSIYVPISIGIAVIVYYGLGREGAYRSAERQFSKAVTNNWRMETVITWAYVAATLGILFVSVLVAV